MSELQVVEHETDYGSRAEGIVAAEDREIDVTLRSPPEDLYSGYVYVASHGLSTSGNSLRPFALAAVAAGHKAVTYNYTNTDYTAALHSNAVDCAAVMDALPLSDAIRAFGHSEGGPVTLEGMLLAERTAEIATLYASAKFLSRKPTTLETVSHFAAEGLELHRMSRNPVHALHLGLGVVRNCARRPRGVIGELAELVSPPNARHMLDALKGRPDAPHIRYIIAAQDRLIPAEHQFAGIEGTGVDVVIYNDGHSAPARKDGGDVARFVFERDALVPPPSYREEPRLAA